MYYFAYGMNMDATLMPEGSKLVAAGTLHGWQLDFRHYADVQPVEGAQVPGVIWDITDHGLACLDAREGYRGGGGIPNFYDRVEAEVETRMEYGDSVQTVKALVYTMEDHRDLRPPSASYLNILYREAIRFGWDTSYLDEALGRIPVEVEA